jgi:glycosyltransferase involved in cell wall biosynthesis
MISNIHFSVLIFTYNRAHFLPEAIESVLTQLIPGDEFIIVDDGSTDNTPSVVQQYLDRSNVRYVRKPHTKAPDSRNRAIKEAVNPYVIWLGSDDILMPHVLDTYRRKLEQYPGADVIYGNLEAFGAVLTGQKKKFSYPDYYKKNTSMLNHLFYRNAIPDPGTLVKRSIYERFGGYDLRFDRAQDYEFWIRVVTGVTFLHCKKTVLMWRWHDGNLSAPSVKSDPKFTVMAFRRLLERYTMEELFASLNWKNHEFALATSYLKVVERAARLNDFHTMKMFFNKFLACKPYAHTDTELLLLLPVLDKDTAGHLHAMIPPDRLRRTQSAMEHKIGRSFREKFRLALYFLEGKRYPDAEKRFLRLVKQIRGKQKYRDLLLASYLHLADMYHEQGKDTRPAYYGKAVEILEARGARTGEERYRIASLCKKANQFPKAGRIFRELAGDHRNKTLFPGIYFHLGEIALLEKENAIARIHFKTCLALNPAHKKAREYLARIE